MKLLAILNPRADRGRAEQRLAELRELTADSPHRFEWTVTPSVAEMRAAIKAATVAGYDGVILAGGDGTISGALPALLKAGLPFGVIPCGRGNDFARNVGLPLSPAEASAFPERPERRTIDIPTANGVPFGSVACLGFDARVNELARRPNRFLPGQSAYVYATMKALISFEPFQVEISHHTGRVCEDVMMVTVANGCCYGGGMKIAPNADMSDGLLDVCIVLRMGKWSLLREFPGVYGGRHVGHPRFMSFRASSVRISSQTRQFVFADGEPIASLPVTCLLDGQRLEILQPISTR